MLYYRGFQNVYLCYSNIPGAIVNIEGQNKYDKNHIYLLWGKHHVRLSLKYENVNYNVKLARPGQVGMLMKIFRYFHHWAGVEAVADLQAADCR